MTAVLRVEDVRLVRERRTLLDAVSLTADHPITIERSGGRWTARAS